MTNLDHGKFSRVTTTFHSLLALTVFFLFFTGYAIAFNTELWWMVELMGGNRGVLAVHRFAGFSLILLTGFWVTFMLLRSASRANFREVLPDLRTDLAAFIQDVKFALGRTDERHPAARQFAGYKAEEVPLISYVGKGVIWIFTVELLLLMLSGLLIWRKTWLIDFYNSQSVVMAFVAFHGLLGVIMLMGVMFHTFEHGFHPAFYPVEMKAFLPKDRTPNFHDDPDEYETTGIDRLRLRPSWRWATNLMGVLVVVGIVSVMMASLSYGGYPVPDRLQFNEGSVLRTIGVNIGMLVLLVGLMLSVYGNVLRARYLRRRRTEPAEDVERAPATADGGDRDGGTQTSTDGGPRPPADRSTDTDRPDGTADSGD
ncbi:cytochrome b/b6 domain-containing protein [Natrinema salifodinae]|uniref:Cytochrome b subunit of formate dehydrogenase n=1 Tax=Natrinema salifodinae TaxID=1202768 RepID=A0A1I0M9W5_9EURY|nr:cytochrome b/b6 domain-containing protein [Natrinema salifodinae]SEV85029.1 Cytochrome b subunit of formate dehydrogenase [Natrinema salifodinae]